MRRLMALVTGTAMLLAATSTPSWAAADQGTCSGQYVEMPSRRKIPCSLAPARFSADFVKDEPEATDWSLAEMTFVATDPRISGKWIASSDDRGQALAYTREGSDQPLFIVTSTPVRIENPEGSWVGHQEGVRGGAHSESFIDSQTILAGEGAYEGLTAILYDPQNDWHYEGVIFPAPPPQVEPLAPPSPAP
jgi:hypothetical protein